MKRTALSSIALVALVFAACTSNSGAPSGNDGGAANDGGKACQAPGVSAACTRCLATQCRGLREDQDEHQSRLPPVPLTRSHGGVAGTTVTGVPRSAVRNATRFVSSSVVRPSGVSNTGSWLGSAVTADELRKSRTLKKPASLPS